MPRQAFWTAPARSWLARNGPRSALGRHLGVQKPSRARPDAFLKRPWAPKTAQDRFFVDLGGRFGLDFRGFSNDFLSIFARAACDEDTKAEPQKGVAWSSAQVLALALGSRFVLLARLSKLLSNVACSAFFIAYLKGSPVSVRTRKRQHFAYTSVAFCYVSSRSSLVFNKQNCESVKKLDLDFGMPDPHPMDSTFGNTQMFGKMCYLNTLHKCLARCVI